jgi:hypothetical protein
VLVVLVVVKVVDVRDKKAKERKRSAFINGDVNSKSSKSSSCRRKKKHGGLQGSERRRSTQIRAAPLHAMVALCCVDGDDDNIMMMTRLICFTEVNREIVFKWVILRVPLSPTKKIFNTNEDEDTMAWRYDLLSSMHVLWGRIPTSRAWTCDVEW